MKPFSERRAVSPSRKLYLYWRKIVPPKLRTVCWNVLERLSAARLKYTSITRHEFIKDIRSRRSPEAGVMPLQRLGSRKNIGCITSYFYRKEEIRGRSESMKTTKISMRRTKREFFQPTRDFYLEFNRFYMNHVKNLNCLGLFYQPASMEMELIRYYRLKNKFIYFVSQEPGRTDEGCYLPYFRDKRCC